MTSLFDGTFFCFWQKFVFFRRKPVFDFLKNKYNSDHHGRILNKLPKFHDDWLSGLGGHK